MNEAPRNRRVKRSYDEAFRREAVALVESSDEPLAEIAKKLGVSHWNLRDWRRLYGKARSSKAAKLCDMSSELGRLRREVESLKAQRDVLKKALGILAEPSSNATRA